MQSQLSRNLAAQYNTQQMVLKPELWQGTADAAQSRRDMSSFFHEHQAPRLLEIENLDLRQPQYLNQLAIIMSHFSLQELVLRQCQFDQASLDILGKLLCEQAHITVLRINSPTFHFDNEQQHYKTLVEFFSQLNLKSLYLSGVTGTVLAAIMASTGSFRCLYLDIMRMKEDEFNHFLLPQINPMKNVQKQAAISETVSDEKKTAACYFRQINFGNCIFPNQNAFELLVRWLSENCRLDSFCFTLTQQAFSPYLAGALACAKFNELLVMIHPSFTYTPGTFLPFAQILACSVHIQKLILQIPEGTNEADRLAYQTLMTSIQENAQALARADFSALRTKQNKAIRTVCLSSAPVASEISSIPSQLRAATTTSLPVLSLQNESTSAIAHRKGAVPEQRNDWPEGVAFPRWIPSLRERCLEVIKTMLKQPPPEACLAKRAKEREPNMFQRGLSFLVKPTVQRQKPKSKEDASAELVEIRQAEISPPWMSPIIFQLLNPRATTRRQLISASLPHLRFSTEQQQNFLDVEWYKKTTWYATHWLPYKTKTGQSFSQSSQESASIVHLEMYPATYKKEAIQVSFMMARFSRVFNAAATPECFVRENHQSFKMFVNEDGTLKIDAPAGVNYPLLAEQIINHYLSTR